MSEQTRPKRLSSCLIALLILLGACLLLAAVSALSNLGLPAHQTSDRIPDLDKTRLAEALHLKETLGDQVWPGWGEADIPVILWHQAYEFLVGYPGQTPAGWEVVSGDVFNGQAYFWRPAVNPQNFAVQVGDRWAASMATKNETDVFLIETFRRLFPPPIRQIFPYRLILQTSETQIGGVLHESLHVYQQDNAPQRLEQAEVAHQLGERYESAADAFQPELKQEYALLAQALGAESDLEAADLTRRFLQSRDARRLSYHLDPNLVAYERWLEWEEGMAKYVEIACLRQAYQTPSYTPLPAMQSDPYFKSYRNFKSRWSQELLQLRNPSGSVETRFYMTGMAESFLLDRLLPDWKSRIMADGIFLEDLLWQAVSGK